MLDHTRVNYDIELALHMLRGKEIIHDLYIVFLRSFFAMFARLYTQACRTVLLHSRQEIPSAATHLKDHFAAKAKELWNDGRAAQRWGSTPKGEVFDDVADGTSFGLTVGLIIATSFSNLWVGVVIGGLYLAAVVYRLVRFLVEKRKAGITGGVTTFSGMPSPAGALIAGVTCVLIPGLVSGLVVIATSLLMVSRVPYAHFGRAILPRLA